MYELWVFHPFLTLNGKYSGGKWSYNAIHKVLEYESAIRICSSSQYTRYEWVKRMCCELYNDHDSDRILSFRWRLTGYNLETIKLILKWNLWRNKFSTEWSKHEREKSLQKADKFKSIQNETLYSNVWYTDLEIFVKMNFQDISPSPMNSFSPHSETLS